MEITYRWNKTFNYEKTSSYLTHPRNLSQGHLSASLNARFRFKKRNGNPEITLVCTNFLVISVICNFSRGITNTKNQLLGAIVYRVECEEVVSKNGKELM